MFQPKFAIGPKTAKALMRIEACRQFIESAPISVRLLDSLRSSARLLSTHYSTQIEGNRLTPSQVKQVVRGGGPFPGRERDEREVRYYHQAIEYMEELATERGVITEAMIRTLHGFVEFGKRTPTPYRDAQNVIKNSKTGGIVYLPPEAKDVPKLMKALVTWLNRQLSSDEHPAPVIAALVHYQFATIHPYFDGNGRTARLLTTLVLHRGGYGLRGIYSLEEYYAKHLADYYRALTIGKSHNYYEGRATSDCSPFVEYFCIGMAESFEAVRKRAEESAQTQPVDDAAALRGLLPRQRSVLGLFQLQKTVSTKELAAFLGIKSRSASSLAGKWVRDGFFAAANASKKTRRYQLTEKYEALVAAAD